MPCQRVNDLMAGKTPDRLPWLPELNSGFINRVCSGEWLGPREASQASAAARPVDNRPYVQIESQAAGIIGADHMHRVHSVKVVRHRVTVSEPDADGLTVIDTPAGQLRRRQTWEPSAGTVYTREHYIKGPESFPAFMAMMEDETYEPMYAEAEAEIAQSGLATMEAPATPLMHLLMWEMDVQPTLMAMLDHREAMIELMNVMHAKNKEFYRVAAAGPGKILRPMEDTSAMLTGPGLYREFCLPMLREYAAIAHAGGKLFIPHMCGHLRDMVGVLAEADLDGIEAITPPPLGDADLADMRRRLGDIWLLGGVAPSLYATATVGELVAHVRHTLDVMRGDRHFILGHEEIPVAAKAENVQAVARLVEQTAEGFYGH